MVNLIMIAPIVIMGYLLYSELDGHIESMSSQQLGLRYIAKIRPLIQHIPQHRGMLGGFLSGDESFRQMMLSKQSAIEEMFARMADADDEMGAVFMTGSRVQNLTGEWKTLKSKIFTYTPQKSYLAHTQLITNMIGLITHVTETSGLRLDPNLYSHYLMDLVVEQIPILTEGMGQSRAIGSVVAARGMISSREREQLVLRLDRIQMAKKKLSNNLTIAFDDKPGLKRVLSGHEQLLLESVASFHRLIEFQLLNTDNINISAAEIFSSSTKAIDTVFDTYDAIIPELEQSFSERILDSRRTQIIALFLIIGAVLLVIIVSVIFYKTLNRFKTTLDMTKDCVFMFEPNNHKFFYVNQSATEQVGYGEAELMKMTPIDIFPDYDEAKIREMSVPMFEQQQESVNFETDLVHKDGHLIPVDISLQYIKPKGEPARYVAIVRNIAERKVMQEQVQIHESESQETQQRFAFAVEGAGDGIWDWDMSTNYMAFSRIYMAMLGYKENELPHHFDTWSNSVHPDDMPRVQQELNDYLEGRLPLYAVELRLRCKDDSYKWILCRGTVVSRDDEGKPVRMIGIHSDITKRKWAEEDLNRYKTTLDVINDGVFMFDPDSLKFFYTNQGVIEEIGYSKAELTNMTPVDVKPDYDEVKFRKLIQPMLDGKSDSVTFETIHRHKDGHDIPVEISLQYIETRDEPSRFVAIVRNITERREVESRLRETEEQNRLLLESVGEGIFGLDTNGKTTFVNPAACIMLGYKTEELIGQDMHSLIHHSYPDGSTYPLEKCPVYDAFTNGTVHKIDDEVLWCKNGSSFPVEYTCTPINKGGEHVGVVINFRNIRERIEADRELVSARDEAEQANQAKSEFLSSMSHELRTPMNAILGFAQILEYDGELSEENTDNVQEILKAGHHLLELINEVLDLARIESGRIDLSLEPVEVCPVVHECLNLVGTLIDKRDIHINHSGLEGAVVRADRTRFKQVLLNLLSNAVKYNREKGSVKLDMQSVGEDRLRIRVTDTGPGIPAEHLAELFQPFNRLDAENSEIEGTGIGLTITRRIVELMGGTVDVESEIGVGSTFWIELPLESQPKSEHGHEWVTIDSETLTQSSDAAEHTVLYIEDNPANLKLVAQLVGRRKHIHLLTAHTPELGIELALSHRPELILLDINMPGMDGYQVLEVFKAEANLKSIPVVAITANAMPRDIERGMAAGFTDYLTKPLDVTRFLAALDSNLGIDE